MILNCDSKTVPNWYFKENSHFKNVEFLENNYTLVIRSVQLKQKGFYYCQGSLFHYRIYALSSAFLNVFGELFYFIMCSGHVTVAEKHCSLSIVSS